MYTVGLLKHTFSHLVLRNNMPYYAVRAGRQPGVYRSWDECKEQVDHFNRARYKKFSTEEEAWEFVNETGFSDTSPWKSSHSLPRRENAVHKYQMKECEEASSSQTLLSLKGSLQQVKHSLNQACNLVNQAENLLNSVASGGKRTYAGREAGGTTKKLKTTSAAGYDEPNSRAAIVYTDGSCVANGRNGAKAGVGVYWGHNHPRNISERLPGRQTNNRAEIYAATRAVRQAKESGIKDLVIRTDSQFVINCMTSWIHKWKRNGWTLSTGKPVINKEELEELDSELSSSVNVKWEHVRGHVGVEGNEAADRLANEGANQPRVS